MKAILFVRVSTEQQDLMQQEAELRTLARRYGYHDKDMITIQHKESAIKLSETERLGINAMKEAAGKDPTIKCVFVYELSRLSRRSTGLLEIRDWLVENKIDLICLKPEFRLLDNKGEIQAASNLLYTMFAAFVENEMKTAKSRMIRGKHFKQEAGYYCGGSLLFGYLKDSENKIYIDESLRDIIIDVFTRCAEGEPLWAVCGRYEREGLIKGTQKTIYNMLSKCIKNLSYSGRSDTHTHYPAIISCELQDEAIRKFTDLKKPHTGQAPSLLQGLIYDVESGRRYTPRNNKRQYFIDFTGRLLSFNKANIEHIVWEALVKHLKDDVKTARRSAAHNIKDGIKRLTNEYNKIRSTYGQLDERMTRAGELYMMGRLTRPQYDTAIAKVDSDRRKLLIDESTLLGQMQRLHRQQDSVKNDIIDFDKMNDTQRRQLVLDHILRIDTQKTPLRGEYMIMICFKDMYTIKYKYRCQGKSYKIDEII